MLAWIILENLDISTESDIFFVHATEISSLTNIEN